MMMLAREREILNGNMASLIWLKNRKTHGQSPNKKQRSARPLLFSLRESLFSYYCIYFYGIKLN